MRSCALRCAQAVTAALATLHLEARVGVHTGECEMLDGDIGGLAVHIAARIMALGGPGEGLVSSTVRGLVVGSGLRFADRGEHALRGVPDRWRTFALER